MKIKTFWSRMSISLLLLAIVISVSAWSFAAGAKEKVKIRYYNLWPNNDQVSINKAYAVRIEQFVKTHPDIDLQVSSDSTAWETKIKTMLASGELPEVFISQPSDFTVFADTGEYQDLSSILNNDKKWKNSFISGSLNTLAKNGKVYGIPLVAYTEGVFYNKELFEKYHLKYPTTYDELKNVVKVFARNGIATITTGFKDAWPTTVITQFLLDREAGYQYFKDSLSKRENTFENPDYVKAFDKFLELVSLGAFPKSIGGQSMDDAKAFFIQGKAAMILDGDWDVGYFTSADNGNFIKKVKFANFPKIADGKGVQDAITVGVGKCFCISAKASEAQRKAGAEFIKFMTNDAAAKFYLENYSLTCATKVSKVDKTKVSPLQLQVSNVVGKSSQTWPAYGEGINPGFYDEMNKVSQALILQGITAADAAKRIEKARLEFQINQK